MSRRLARRARDFLGPRTPAPMLVIESDDWGAVRVPDRAALAAMRAEGLDSSNPFDSLDSLERPEDLHALLDALGSVKDANGHCARFTMNTVMANPDLPALVENGFSSYKYQPINALPEQYPFYGEVLALFGQGMDDGRLRPQFHGREHLNVPAWMQACRDGTEVLLKAARCGVYGLDVTLAGMRRRNFMAAWDFHGPEEQAFVLASIRDGLQLFKNQFGIQSVSAIAPCYVWDQQCERVAAEDGVRFFQGIVRQYVPRIDRERYGFKLNYTGRSGQSGVRYLVRNCFFEPSLEKGRDVVADCLARLDDLFSMNRLAVLSTHRINFMGGIEPKNRDVNIQMFSRLLGEIVKRWPAVEFHFADSAFARLDAG
ncbi:MAG: hypothetical protein JJU31_08720 [Wenzhouxiangella sp.]|nr:hypothetical protein [Wenzhouxiangella sp.]